MYTDQLTETVQATQLYRLDRVLKHAHAASSNNCDTNYLYDFIQMKLLYIVCIFVQDAIAFTVVVFM